MENNDILLGYVLLKDATFDFNKFLKELKKTWKLKFDPKGLSSSNTALAANVDGMTVSIALAGFPIPEGAAEEDAKANFRWDDAVNVAKSHKAHLVVGLVRNNANPVIAADLFVKLCCACLEQPSALAMNKLGTVMHPGFYKDMAKAYIKDGSFPVTNMVYVGIYSNDNGKTFCGYTFGLEAFDKRNFEILDSQNSPGDVEEMLMNLSSYVIEGDVSFKGGETVGITEDQRLKVTLSKGVAVDGTTIKVSF